MNIVFPYPDFESLGVEYLLAVCEAKGHPASLYFYHAEDSYLNTKKEADYAHLARSVLARQPGMIAFSCVTDNYRYQLALSQEIKRQKQDVTIVFGGVHPTAVPYNVIQDNSVDCVIVGEAEESLMRYVDAHDDISSVADDFIIPGAIFKSNGTVHDGIALYEPPRDMDSLPFVDKRHFCEHLDDARSEYRIISSRGCPFKCSYCFNSFYHSFRGKHTVRRRSVRNVIDELHNAKTGPFNYVIFVDDCFTASKKWLSEFLDLYKKEIDMPFSCTTHPSSINDDVARALNEAGCVHVQIGVQSLSEEICANTLYRRSNNNTIENAIHALKKAKIMVQADHMLGIPGDSVAIQEESVRFYNRARPDLVSIFWLTYYPKTTIIELAVQIGILKPEDVQAIEEGTRIHGTSYLTGGDCADPHLYYGLSFVMNWLPLLPKWLVELLIAKKLYRYLAIKNFYLSTALPRSIQCLYNSKDFKGRGHLLRFFGNLAPWAHKK